MKTKKLAESKLRYIFLEVRTIMHSNSFLPEHTIHIQASSFFDAGFQYGVCMKDIVKQRTQARISETSNASNLTLNQASELLSYAEKLRDSGVFTINNRNVLGEYLDIIYGYCMGAGISKLEGVMLQAEISGGCQSMLIRNTKNLSIGFLHTEENFDDKNLREIYKYIDSHASTVSEGHLPAEIQSKYQYKVVDIRVQHHSYTFFGYPDLCFGGPAMGTTHNNTVFTCVDSLYTVTTIQPHALWANAVATMFYLLGDIDAIRELSNTLKRLSSYVIKGYAFHIADSNRNALTSFEFGGNQYVEILPDRHGDVEYIGQPNYPRSSQLLHIDELYEIENKTVKTDIWQAQTVFEMKHRTSYLRHICLDPRIILDSNFHETIQKVMYDQCNILETDFHEPNLESPVGFITPYLAGYVTGIMTTGHISTQFGTLFPKSKDGSMIKFWYSKTDSQSHQYTHLYQKANELIT